LLLAQQLAYQWIRSAMHPGAQHASGDFLPSQALVGVRARMCDVRARVRACAFMCVYVCVCVCVRERECV